MSTAVTVTSTPDHDSGYRTGETFTFEVTWDLELEVESVMTINLQVGDSVRKATMPDEATKTTVLAFEYTFTDADVDADGIEILNSLARPAPGQEDEDVDSYIFATADEELGFMHAILWEFVNPSPGVLSDHKVVQVAEVAPVGLSWQP